MSKNSFLISLLLFLTLAFNPIWADEGTESGSEGDETAQTTENSGDDNSNDDNSNDDGLTGCEVIVDLDKGTMEMPCVLVNGEQYQVKMSTQRGNSMNWKVVFLALEDDSVILDETDESGNEEDDSNNETSNDESENENENENEENDEEDDEEDDEENDDNGEEECVPANANANNCKDKEK